MGLKGGGFKGRSPFVAAGALALALGACASGPPPNMYDLAAAKPPRAHAVRAQFRVGQQTATADLDSDRILVRDAQSLATLTRAELGTLVGSLAQYQDDFARALDILLTGF